MADPLMAAAMLGGGALSAFSGMSAADKQNDIYKQILAALKGLQGEQRVAGGQALGFLQQGLQATRGGFQNALAETARLGDAAELDAREIAARDLGAAKQDLISAGRFNPGDLAYARMGISSNLQRNLGALAERVAQVRGGLMASGGQAEAGALGALAGQTSQNFDQRANLVGAGLDFMGASAPTAYNPASDLGWLFAGLSQLGGGGGSTPSGGGGMFGTGGYKNPSSPWYGYAQG